MEEESEGSRIGQREELNLDNISANVSASPTGSLEAGMILLSCLILRQRGWLLTPHVCSWVEAAHRKLA